MKKIFKYLLWTLLAAVFVGTFVFLYLNSRTKSERYQIVCPSDSITIERSTVLTGKIEPRDEIEIKPQISGIISEILVEPGEFVNDGDIIARIKVIPSAAELSSAQNRVDVARISLTDAERKYNREKALYERKVISREEFETAEATWEKARRELESALDSYQIVREGISSTNASESNTNVRATITGIVLDIPVKVGSSVIQANTMNDGTTVATIADMNNLIFKGKVDETEVGQIRVGLPMEIRIGALPDVSPTAVIEYIAPKGVETNGANTFEIKGALTVGNDTVTLRSGYSANATVVLSRSEARLTVPESVVEFSGDSTFVYILTDSVPEQKFVRRPIETGMSDGINIEVKSGIDASARLRGNVIKE
ncbi:MAG: efflux RND transporter periplasmic adaptor subunit [Clostridium sp.]|nr:efflux RND transporter periplasmic adaptor subunit [Clostridium sp.]